MRPEMCVWIIYFFCLRNVCLFPVRANKENACASLRVCVSVCVCVMRPVVCADQKTVADCAHPGLFLGHAELSGNRRAISTVNQLKKKKKRKKKIIGANIV